MKKETVRSLKDKILSLLKTENSTENYSKQTRSKNVYRD